MSDRDGDAIVRCEECGAEIAHATTGKEKRCVWIEDGTISFTSWEHAAIVTLRCPDCHD